MFKRTQKKEFGQALVETAITMPLLILILSGLFDLGRIYYTFIALEEAAAEAARYLAIEPSCPTPASGAECSDPNNALYRAEHAGNKEFDILNADWNIPYDAAAIALGFEDPFSQCGGVISIGCVVVVQLQYPYTFITPGISAIANNVSGGAGLTLEVQATEIMVYE
jgi:hypothetical protein